MDKRRVEARTVEYFAIDQIGREMHVPHITAELAERWTAEGLHIVTRERRRLVPIFGVLQTVLREPSLEQPPALASPICAKSYITRSGRQALCGFDPFHTGPCGSVPGLGL